MKFLAAVLLAVATTAGAQERIDLTAAETKPSNAQYRVERMILDFEAGAITLQLLGQNNEARTCLYNASTTPTGATLLTGLNKANLSSAYAGNGTSGSLKQRIFHRLVVMGEAAEVCGVALNGTLGGTVP
jgi:hypothetical protein